MGNKTSNARDKVSSGPEFPVAFWNATISVRYRNSAFFFEGGCPPALLSLAPPHSFPRPCNSFIAFSLAPQTPVASPQDLRSIQFDEVAGLLSGVMAESHGQHGRLHSIGSKK